MSLCLFWFLFSRAAGSIWKSVIHVFIHVYFGCLSPLRTRILSVLFAVSQCLGAQWIIRWLNWWRERNVAVWGGTGCRLEDVSLPLTLSQLPPGQASGPAACFLVGIEPVLGTGICWEPAAPSPLAGSQNWSHIWGGSQLPALDPFGLCSCCLPWLSQTVSWVVISLGNPDLTPVVGGFGGARVPWVWSSLSYVTNVHSTYSVSSEYKIKHTLGAKFSRECLSSLWFPFVGKEPLLWFGVYHSRICVC